MMMGSFTNGVTILILALAATLQAIDASGQARAGAPRPTVGVALGGGSARGIAHVGVLRWLEEHRIPIDGPPARAWAA